MKMPHKTGRGKMGPNVRMAKSRPRLFDPHRRPYRIGAMIASVVIAAGLVALPTAAMAYTKTGVSWSTGKLTIDFRYVNGNFRTALNNSNLNYNVTTHVALSTTDTAGPAWTALNSNYGATGWEAQASWTSNLFYKTTSCKMQANQYYLSGSEPLNRLKVVWEHETGHCLGLDHVTSATHVMYKSASDAFRQGITALTTDEINGINTMY